jgi:LacI family transcriptional regulator
MLRSGIDGLIITSFSLNQDICSAVEHAKIPVVELEEHSHFHRTDCVQTSCTSGAYEIVEHLIKMGHQKIALVTGPPASYTACERKKGYLRALEDYNVPVNPDYIIAENYASDFGYQAIQELGYTPNRNAQLLRAKNTHTIGILISDLGNYFWGELINSIIKHFTDHGYTVIVCSFFFEHQKEIDTIQDIISQHFAGVIMLPSCWHDDLYQLLQNAGIPVVMLDQIPASMRHFPVDCVISDNYKGGALLAEHLLEKGHTKVWIMEQYLDAYTIEQRIQGFVDVYQKNGIDLLKQQDSFPPVSFGSTAETVIQSNLHFQKLIDSSDPPTAVFFDCYLSAMGGLSAASQARISVPQDISFVCFDDDPLFKTMSAAMTCVSQDLTSIGKHAVELLLKRIHGDYTDFPKIDMLDVVFHPRLSVKDLSGHNSTTSGKD